MTIIMLPSWYEMKHAMMQRDPFDPDMTAKRRSEIMGGRCWGVHKLHTSGGIVATRQVDVDDCDEWDRQIAIMRAECDLNIECLDYPMPPWLSGVEF